MIIWGKQKSLIETTEKKTARMNLESLAVVANIEGCSSVSGV